MLDYFYKTLNATMGQFEVLYYYASPDGLDRCLDGLSEVVEGLRLNDVFPSVTYGPGLTSDDKSYPLKVFLYQAPPECGKCHICLLQGFPKCNRTPMYYTAVNSNSACNIIICNVP